MLIIPNTGPITSRCHTLDSKGLYRYVLRNGFWLFYHLDDRDKWSLLFPHSSIISKGIQNPNRLGLPLAVVYGS